MEMTDTFKTLRRPGADDIAAVRDCLPDFDRIFSGPYETNVRAARLLAARLDPNNETATPEQRAAAVFEPLRVPDADDVEAIRSAALATREHGEDEANSLIAAALRTRLDPVNARVCAGSADETEAPARGPLAAYAFPPELGSGSLRVVLREDAAWFVASDLLTLLDLDRKALERLDEDEKGVSSIHTPGGAQRMTLVNQFGLFTLIIGSRKPEAKPFKRWVTHEVLPAIARTGSYSDSTGQMARTLAQATDGALTLAETAQRQIELLEGLSNMVATLTQAVSAMQITVARSVQSHSRQIARAFRLAEMRQPVAPDYSAGDPDRKLTKAEREKALHMWRSSVPFRNISKRLNRSHKVIERWAASEPEVIKSLVARDLF